MLVAALLKKKQSYISIAIKLKTIFLGLNTISSNLKHCKYSKVIFPFDWLVCRAHHEHTDAGKVFLEVNIRREFLDVFCQERMYSFLL